MEQIADFGVASHWKYKDPKKIKEKDTREYQWMHDLLDLMNNSTSQDELIENSKLNYFKIVYMYFHLREMLLSCLKCYIYRLCLFNSY